MENKLEELLSIEKIESKLSSEVVLFYISSDACNVCKILKPKIHELLNRDFPKIEKFYISIDRVPQIGGRFLVFTVPTVLIFINGSETIRESRNISMSVFREKIERFYNILF